MDYLLKKRLIILLFFIGLTTSALVSERSLRLRKTHLRIPPTPVPLMIKYTTFGHARGFSALLWINLLAWYGEGVLKTKTGKIRRQENIAYFISQTRAIIELDPEFEDPYPFAIMVLTWYANRPSDAVPFVLRAMQQFPDKWIYPFYYGFLHYRFFDNRKVAAHYFLLAGKRGAPSYVPLLGARLQRQQGTTQDAIDLLESILAQPNVPNDIRASLEGELLTLNAIRQVEDAVAQYRRLYHTIPSMLDLRSAGLILDVPKDAAGLPLFIKPDGTVIAQSGGQH